MEPATLAILGAGLASALGSVYSNSVNAANTAAANKKNADMQYAINYDNLAAAQMNNLTQIDLANTAHQREMRDLIDAGLNPILTATGGNGASTPTLHTPSLDAPKVEAPSIVNPLSNITSAVGQAMQYADSHRISDAQAKLLEGEVPYDPQLLRAKANAQANSAIAQAKADAAQARYDETMMDVRNAVLENGLYVSAPGQSGEVKVKLGRGASRDYDPGNLVPLVKQMIISDMKDVANRNWRNNVNSARQIQETASGAIDSVMQLKGKPRRLTP